jgi:hypothetical protein
VAKYIDGIFNYCDRWCERCPFTGRCRNFAMGRAIERHARRKDKENEAFWRAMDKACGEALGDVTRQAESLGGDAGPKSDEDEREKAEFGREMDERERRVRGHPLARLADEYLWDAHRWLERRRGRVPDAIADAVEVISWYHMFIDMKFLRALSGVVDEDEDDEDAEDLVDDAGVAFPRDSDGSAKVAVIAVERSFAAWSLVRDRVPAERNNAGRMMGVLLRIRAMAERAFPDARKFHRPGFDDVGSRD